MSGTLSILGDSISTFSGCVPADFAVYYDAERQLASGVSTRAHTWWGIVAESLSREILGNASYSGSLVEGDGFPAGESARRIEALAPGGTCPDDVIVFMGINDFGWGGAETRALCLAEGGSRASCDGALASFAGAYARMLAGVRKTCPDARIWCCTLAPGRLRGCDGATFTWRVRGIDLDAYDDAIRRAARAAGCELVDLRAFGRDYEAWDGLHPTAAGMRQIAGWVLYRMREAGVRVEGAGAALADDAAAGRDGASPSTRFCEKPSCASCPFSDVSDGVWSTVCGLAR